MLGFVFDSTTARSRVGTAVEAPPRTATDVIADILREMNVTPIPESAVEAYKRAVLGECGNSTERGFWSMNARQWTIMELDALPPDAPPVPGRMLSLLDGIHSRAAMEGVTTNGLLEVLDDDPLVMIAFKNGGGGTTHLYVGGYALDGRHRELLTGGVLI